jgi:Na+-translocating ferredoxin:NAD+ oxidoreductase subunit D
MSKTDILSSPHKHNGSSVRAIMIRVCLALLPGLLCYSWFFGFGVLVQCLLAVGFALMIEAILLRFRRRELSVFLNDGSAIVTALLFAIMITPLTPWWVSLIGISFGLIFAKHLYGGLGHNLFNPAATAYIFILLCFPVLLNNWPVAGGMFAGSADMATVLEIIFSAPGNRIADIASVDALSGATPLGDMQTRLAAMAMVSEIQTGPIYGSVAGFGWEWINLAFLLGGIYLIHAGIISWRIPVAMLAGFFISSTLFSLYDSAIYASPLFHLFSGGTMLGAFFIATDPVTASTTPKGRIIYGCLIGVIAYIIRIWGAYPDGIAFAVLIANACVPLIDRYTRPKIIGEL